MRDQILDDLLKGSRGKKGRTMSPNDLALPKRNSSQKPLTALYLTAKKLPQAVTKITSFGKGYAQVLNHLSYISRNGELSLEDQDGQILNGGIAEQAELLDTWASDFGDRVNSRDSVHLMLSAPEGSASESLKIAARTFLQKEFGNKHPYVFAIHTDTQKPHAHVCIKLMGEEGKKLNPRKDTLDGWREKFAKECREQGILVEASRRFERGLSGKKMKDTARYVQARGEKLYHPSLRANEEKARTQTTEQRNEKEEKQRARNQAVRRHYIEAARNAAQQIKNLPPGQQKAMMDIVKTLDDFAKTMPFGKANLVTSYQEYLHLKKGISMDLNAGSNSKKMVAKEIAPKNELERND